jgi:Tfp pilus assembly protein PilV
MTKRKGISLIEVVAALGIAVIVITALVSLSIYTLRTSTQSKQLLASTKQVNTQLEYIRNYRDSKTWSAFLTSMENCTTSKACIISALGGSISVQNVKADSALGASEVYVYFQATDPNSADGSILSSSTTVRVHVIAKWRIGDLIKSTDLYMDFTNWQNK